MKRIFNKTTPLGFTLLELLVAIAIVAVLVAMSTPVYLRYLERSKYSHGLQMADQVKLVVADYYQHNDGVLCGDNTTCGASAPAVYAGDFITTITISTGGVVTVLFDDGKTYILTPNVNAAGNILWVVNGTACQTQGGAIGSC